MHTWTRIYRAALREMAVDVGPDVGVFAVVCAVFAE